MIASWFHWQNDSETYAKLSSWISHRIYGKDKHFGNGTIMAVTESDTLAAGLIFYDYDADAGVIQVSAAADTPRWLTRPVLWELFNYPFNQIGCQAVVMRVDPANTRLARILTAYGFSKHIIPRLRGRDKDEALFVLTDDAWKANGFHKKAM